MPEGPTIFLLSQELKDFVGQRIINVRGNSKAGIDKTLNSTITDIRSWGKQLLISLDNGHIITIHFMLFGTYSINEKKPNRKERLGLDLETGEINIYASSVKLLEGNLNSLFDWSGDVLNDSWDHKAALEKVHNLKKELICDVLLSQDIFSGVGNIIKNEVLFRQKVQPHSVTGMIPSELLDKIVKDARDYSFQFLEWKKEYVLKQNLQVHNKKTCPSCGLPLVKKELGKTKRRAFFCTNCQILFD